VKRRRSTPFRIGLLVIALAVIVAWPGVPALGQPPSRVRVEAVSSKATVTPGDQFVIAVVFDHDEGWHVQSHAPVPVKGLEGFEPIATTITARARGGARVGPVQWPRPMTTTVNFTGTPVEFEVHGGRTIAYVPVVVRGDAGGVVGVDLEVVYQACDDTTCLPPERKLFGVEATVVPAGAPLPVPRPDPEGLFAGFDPSVFATMAAGVGDSTGVVAEAARPRFLGLIEVPRADSLAGVVIVSILGVLGGLALNLTPCVLPVIPIKVLTISQHAGSPGRSLILGLWMACGVVAFWVGAGLPVVLLATFTDPSQIFGIWWVTFGIGVLIALMALGVMGMFTLTLPQSVYRLNPKADTAWGSFAFGVMTAVLGLPCFGFVAGALLPATAGAPPVVTMAVFMSLGVGMALPYFVLSARPGLVEKIPRTGPASEVVKQVMGLLLLAAAAYFVGAGLIALVQDRPYMSRLLHWWAVAIFATAAGVWLVVRTFQITRRAGKRAAMSALSAIIGGAAVGYAASATGTARENWERLEAARGSAGVLVTGTWIDYTPALFDEARRRGYVVVVDFTADWCINCKVLKATVLSREPVKGELSRSDVAAFTADLTSGNAPGWEKLRSLGQTGIPLLAIFTPGSEEPWLSNAYTPQQVVEALSRARSGRGGEAGGR
jgi:thiol:disulfide interchange protein DsbD